MLTSLSILALGFLLGMRHAIDPDHVVAVTAIVHDQRSIRRAARIGALWGIGHSATILLVGGAILAFQLVVPPRVGLALELGVALMLIGLGIANLSGEPRAARSDLRPVAIGFVHGLAGSAAVALLVLATIRDPRIGAGYLLVFSLGTVLGMMLMTAAIAVPAAFASSRFGSTRRYFRLASGMASVAMGLLLVFQVGLVDGLFTASPSWTPR